MGYIKRFNVVMCLIDGHKKPALIISPDELNDVLSHVLVAPVTDTKYHFPCRIDVQFSGKKGQIALDLIQPINKEVIIEKMGTLPPVGVTRIIDVLQAFFARD